MRCPSARIPHAVCQFYEPRSEYVSSPSRARQGQQPFAPHFRNSRLFFTGTRSNVRTTSEAVFSKNKRGRVQLRAPFYLMRRTGIEPVPMKFLRVLSQDSFSIAKFNGRFTAVAISAPNLTLSNFLRNCLPSVTSIHHVLNRVFLLTSDVVEL